VRRLLIALALIAGALAPAISASSAVAAGVVTRSPKSPVTGIGVRLVDVPTATLDDARARAYIIDRLAPGSTIQRRIQVSNGTRSRADVSIYPAAASISHGSFLGASGRTANALSTWTAVTPRSINLAPAQKAFVLVTVRVPADAAPGESYGVVWAQLTPPTTPGGLTQVSRVGIRLYLSIGPGGAPASDFAIVSLTAARGEDDAPVVTASVKNTGGRALDLSGDLKLSHGPGGLSAGPFPVTLGTTLGIDQTEPVSVALSRQLPNGPWQANITLTSGLTKRSAQATLTFPSGPGVSAPVVPSSSGVSLPLIAAGVAVLLLLSGLLGVLLLRRRRRRRSEDAETREEVPAGT